MGRYTQGPTAFERACTAFELARTAAAHLVAALVMLALVAPAAAGCLAALDLLARVVWGA